MFASHQRTLVQDSRFQGLALRKLKAREIMLDFSRLRMLRSQLLLLDVQRAFEERLGFRILPLRLVEECQSIQRCRHQGVFRSCLMLSDA